MDLALSDTAEPGTSEAIFNALDRSSRDTIKPADPRLLVIPIRDDAGMAIGGLWTVSLFRWLQVEMLLIPSQMRRQGVDSALMPLAESEALNRDCLGVHVDTFSFQAGLFYGKVGFSQFRALDDWQPGHRRLFFQKRLAPR